MITITETARQKIAKLKEEFKEPVRGVRVSAIPRSPMRASFKMNFVTEREPELSKDIVHSMDDIDVYIDPDTVPYLEGASIDYVFTLFSRGFTVQAPPRKLDTPEGALAERIQKVLDGQINPGLAFHGGGAILIDVKGANAFIEMTGGCQGCSQAGSTMKDGVAAVIKEQVPEIQEVFDVTEHANGRNPYFLR
jgi:Fe/S biogenesis protein NfuA